MATKKPPASVSETSGQGISRRTYQQGRARTAKTSLESPKIKGPKPLDDSGSGRQYDKAKGGKYPGGINVSYGDTYKPTDLEELTSMGKGVPPKGFKNVKLPGKKFK